MYATAIFRIGSGNFSKKILESTKGTEYERNFYYRNYQYFYDFNSPWNLGLSFNVNIDRGFNIKKTDDSTNITASVVLNNFDFNLTKKWKIAITSGYDFNQNRVGITQITAIRDMHCWEFRAVYTPISPYGQGYAIEIRPKSALLQDLKLMKNKPAIDNYF